MDKKNVDKMDRRLFYINCLVFISIDRVKLENISIAARGILYEIRNRHLQNAKPNHYQLKHTSIRRAIKIYCFITKCDVNTNIEVKNYFCFFSR